MKLKDKDYQPPSHGLPASYHEWWDIGNEYEIYVCIESDICSFGIHTPNKSSITYEIASLLGVDTSNESLGRRNHDGEELFISIGIDCVVLNYRKPENYRYLMEKIETIVNDNFKAK